jgi:RHS repeat-associated protein
MSGTGGSRSRRAKAASSPSSAAPHIGRPVFATNATGVKTWTATYQPFGGVHTTTGAPPTNRFPGQWFQSESGLHQNWMRDYDPTTGRYLQPDPLGLIDGASVYGYAAQSPMMLTDPTGEFIPAWAAGAAAGAAIALLFELMENDWRWECVDWWNVGAGAAFGAVGGQAASFWAHGATGYSRYGYGKALRSYRNAFGIRGGGTEVHHVFAVNGAKGAGWRNSAWWLKPLLKSTHRRLHGSWGLLLKYGPARRAWHGSPGWAKGVPFPPAAGAVADWANPCVCEN